MWLSFTSAHTTGRVPRWSRWFSILMVSVWFTFGSFLVLSWDPIENLGAFDLNKPLVLLGEEFEVGGPLDQLQQLLGLWKLGFLQHRVQPSIRLPNQLFRLFMGQHFIQRTYNQRLHLFVGVEHLACLLLSLQVLKGLVHILGRGELYQIVWNTCVFLF